ncbi:thiol peroxidase [Thiomicrospira sp. ALE5]|uniref:thiol peroxidase n=1 Tax=Thiomicrospira sp. ALE5 TaxID=748650 RepID=UPI0008F1C2B2|nr:thiol peroxidase [Thiomicrospira sp. ALE5]SFR56128.1 thiol peroxidase, atypical 2-Cys peroxiredoxin [Thiomicrospira sp. ALE5]
MAEITLKGNPIHTCGVLPEVGSTAVDFCLVASDLSDTCMTAGTPLLLNIFPSIDTGVCAASVRQFNALASQVGHAEIWCISADLPFAQQRFCGADGLDKVKTLSSFRNSQFGVAYGLTIMDGPLAGLLARAVVVIDAQGKVAYTELVPEIAQEPNYDAALNALKSLV